MNDYLLENRMHRDQYKSIRSVKDKWGEQMEERQDRVTVLSNDESGNASWQTIPCPRMNDDPLLPSSLPFPYVH